MGGNAFGLGQIQRQDVSDTLTAFIENFHSENTLGLVGSAMKKSISSDIDVVISNSNLNRNSLYEYLHSNFDASRIKRTGAAEHVMFPIYKGCTPTNDLIQFDVFLVDNIKNAQWLMGDIHRNLLLAMFARRMSESGTCDSETPQPAFPFRPHQSALLRARAARYQCNRRKLGLEKRSRCRWKSTCL